MLDDGSVRSLSEIANTEGLTRASVTQIMNLLKLPAKRRFFVGIGRCKIGPEYSKRKLRKGKYDLLS